MARSLEARGHILKTRETMGVTQAVAQSFDGTFYAASDPRLAGEPSGRAAVTR